MPTCVSRSLGALPPACCLPTCWPTTLAAGTKEQARFAQPATTHNCEHPEHACTLRLMCTHGQHSPMHGGVLLCTSRNGDEIHYCNSRRLEIACAVVRSASHLHKSASLYIYIYMPHLTGELALVKSLSPKHEHKGRLRFIPGSFTWVVGPASPPGRFWLAVFGNMCLALASSMQDIGQQVARCLQDHIV